MLVLASQVLPTQYLEENRSVLALVGEGHMDTPTLVGVVAWAWVVDVAGAGLHHIVTRDGRIMS